MSTKTIFNTFTALAVAATLTVGLAACAPTVEPAPVEKPTATVPATEAPAELDPLDLDGNGSVSEFEKQVAAKNAVRDYTLPDGTVVQLDPTQPFPEPVKAAVKAETAGPIAAGQAFGTKSEALDNLISTLDSKSAATGRGIAVVYQTTSAGEGLIWVIMASGQKQAPFFGSADKASVVAQAQAWVDARSNYELIIH